MARQLGLEPFPHAAWVCQPPTTIVFLPRCSPRVTLALHLQPTVSLCPGRDWTPPSAMVPTPPVPTTLPTPRTGAFRMTSPGLGPILSGGRCPVRVLQMREMRRRWGQRLGILAQDNARPGMRLR